MKIFTVFLFVLFVSVDVAFAADFYNGDEQKNYPGQEAKSQLSDFGENAEKIKKIQENKNNIHIPFISNYGQINEGVKFYADFFSGTFFVSEKELTYLFAKQKKTN